MKLVHTEMNHKLEMEYGQPCEWIIEAPELFMSVVQELYNQKNGLEGDLHFLSKMKLSIFLKK